MIAWLKNWWHGRRCPGTAAVEVVMYTRTGCHLCNDAWQVLQAARQRHSFELRQVNVDSDAELQARYGLEVPVVTIDGKVRFRGQVNAVLLRRLLKSRS